MFTTAVRLSRSAIGLAAAFFFHVSMLMGFPKQSYKHAFLLGQVQQAVHFECTRYSSSVDTTWYHTRVESFLLSRTNERGSRLIGYLADEVCVVGIEYSIETCVTSFWYEITTDGALHSSCTRANVGIEDYSAN